MPETIDKSQESEAQEGQPTRSVAPVPPKKSAKLTTPRFTQAQFKRNIYQCLPEPGTSIEQMLEPAYWTHVARDLRPLDRIEVNAEDGKFYAELIVLSASRTEAIVQLLHHVKLEPSVQAARDTADYEVKWAGSVAKFRVLRKQDKKSLKEGFDTRDQAQAWLNDYLKALAA